jgi:hypothetical protein
MSRNRPRYNANQESTINSTDQGSPKRDVIDYFGKPGQRPPLDVARMSVTKDFRP